MDENATSYSNKAGDFITSIGSIGAIISLDLVDIKSKFNVIVPKLKELVSIHLYVPSYCNSNSSTTKVSAYW